MKNKFKSFGSVPVLIFLITVFLYVPVFVYTRSLANDQIARGIPEKEVLPVYNTDAIGYANLADNLVKYHHFSQSGPDNYHPETFRTPGYPAILAMWKIFFGDYKYFPILQIVFVAVTAVLIYMIGVRLLSSTVGFVAALFYILDPNTVYFSMVLLSEVSFVLFTVLAFYFAFGRSAEASGWSLALAGLFLALATQIRPIAVFLPAVFAVLYFARGKWLIKDIKLKSILLDIVIVVLCFSAVLLPWLARNKVLTGVWGLSSVASFNLFFANVPEFLAARDKISADQARTELYKKIDAPTLKGLDDLKYSSKIQSIALSVIMDDPIGYAKIHIIKTLPVFLSSSLKTIFVTYNNVTGKHILESSTANITTMLINRNFRGVLSDLRAYPATTAEAVILGVLTIFAFLSVILAKGRRFAAVLILTMVLYFALLTGPVANSRFRMPSSPFIFLSASLGISTFWLLARKIFVRQSVISE